MISLPLYNIFKDWFARGQKQRELEIDIAKIDRSIWKLNDDLRHREMKIFRRMGLAADALVADKRAARTLDNSLSTSLEFRDMYNEFIDEVNQIRFDADHERSMLLYDRKKIIGREITDEEYGRLSGLKYQVPVTHTGWHPNVR